MSKDLNSSTIQEILNSNQLVILKFSSPGCGPCKKLSQNLSQALENLPALHPLLLEIDITQNLSLAQQYMIFSVPVLIFFKEGKELKRINGLTGRDELISELKKITG